MRVKHCPSCGSDDIDVSSYSAEYMRSTTYSCGSCNWSYKSGSGMGTGSGNSGTHPRDAGTSSRQGTLTRVGEWCSKCDTSAKVGECRCVDPQTKKAFCKECAKYSSEEADEMLEVATYFGRHSRFKGWDCDVCGDNKAELKTIEE